MCFRFTQQFNSKYSLFENIYSASSFTFICKFSSRVICYSNFIQPEHHSLSNSRFEGAFRSVRLYTIGNKMLYTARNIMISCGHVHWQGEGHDIRCIFCLTSYLNQIIRARLQSLQTVCMPEHRNIVQIDTILRCSDRVKKVQLDNEI